MTNVKKIIFIVAALVCVQLQAEVAVSTIWSAMPGKGTQLLTNGMEAKAIHEKMGAEVSILVDQDNDMHYVVGFSDWVAWGKFLDSMPGNEEWQSFWQRAGEEASAEISGTFMLNVPVVAKSQQVHMVFSWDVQQGQTPSFLALCQQSRKIHERLGASVGVNVDELADVHYELSFENWEAYGKFSENLAVDSEWQEFFRGANAEPVAELTKVWRLNRL